MRMPTSDKPRHAAAAGDPLGAAGCGASSLPLDREAERIEAMFDGIVSRYDLMNRLMTGGMDRRWRRETVRIAAPSAGDRALDVCCGTGDLAFALLDACPGCHVTALDFSEAMLARASEKAAARAGEGRPVPRFIQGDLLSLPFADGEFAAVTVGFGVRNVPDVPRAFAEMARVARPGGRVACLELSRFPQSPLRRVLELWSGRVVPLLGRLVADDASAYAYLPASIATFPTADELAAIMAGAGLINVRYRRFGLGAVALHVGDVPSAP